MIPGIINIKMAHYPAAIHSMLQGENTHFFLYINYFIFPNNIRIPSRPIKISHYFNELSLLPSTFIITDVHLNDIHHNHAITLQYRGNSSYTVFTCDGTPLGPQQTMKSLYFIDDHQNLACLDITNSSEPLTDAQIIIENVDAMRILYGLDTNHDGIADSYIRPNDPTFSLSNVVAMKIFLLLRTFEKNDDSRVATHYLLGKEKVGDYTDGYPRRTLILTFPIKQGAL